MESVRAAVLTIVLTLGVAPRGAQAADATLEMAPSSDWVVDYADDRCALRRAFAAGDEQATLELRQYAPGDNLEIIVVSSTPARIRSEPRVRIEPDEDWYDPPDAMLLDVAAGHGVMYTDNLRPAALKSDGQPYAPWSEQDRDAREQAITGLTLAGTFEPALTLGTGRLREPMDAMRACLHQLVTHWGLDATAQDTLSRKATPIDQMGWARQTMEQYPTDMLRAGKSARLPIRLLVGTDGKPTACVALEGFAEPSFERAACASAMRYARFEPALDASGQPVASYFVTTIIYKTGR
jgi:hypothetical protein